MPARGDGPIPAKIMIVGEAWGEQEENWGKPFVGASGGELDRMLHEAGIMRSECYVSNVVNARPPGNDIGEWMALKKKDITSSHIPMRDKMVLPIIGEGYKQLLTEIMLVQPNVICAFGNVALWALTGKWGIRNWRGSLLRFQPSSFATIDVYRHLGYNPKVIPSIHPASVLREWSQRQAVVNDLRRVATHKLSREYQFPQVDYLVRPSFAQVESTLRNLIDKLNSGPPTWIDADIETGIKFKHIKCTFPLV